MNIDMINNHGANPVNDMEHITYGNPASAGSGKITEKMGFSLDITGKVRENAAYGKEELKSAEDIMQMAGMTNVSLQRDYMAVMSNSMTDEDFAELMKDGADPTKIPADKFVTNLDKIKICFLSQCICFFRRHNAKLFSVLTDKSYFLISNLFINEIVANSLHLQCCV